MFQDKVVNEVQNKSGEMSSLLTLQGVMSLFILISAPMWLQSDFQ